MTIEVAEKGKVTIITVPDKFIDALNSLAIKGEIQNQLKENIALIIDLKNVEFLDSSGLGMLLACMRRVVSMGGELKLANVRQETKNLFELVRFHRIIDVCDSLDEAVQSFNKS